MKNRFSRRALFLAAVLSASASAGTFFPFYDHLETDSGAFFAVRPFYSRTQLPEGEIRDCFWPLYSRKEFKEEKSSRALIFWFTHRFPGNQEASRNRNWLLPFYFQGCDAQGEEYFALFPAGGTIREFLGRDEISFTLFPLYGKSRVNDVRTTSVLWPIGSHTRGEGIARDRVFPFYGKSVLEEKYEKKFVLWPFWTSADYFYPGDKGRVWILFPVCGRGKLDKESTWWVIPPFFRFTDGEEMDKLYCPWPFIQHVEGDRLEKTYIWPLWGAKHFDGGLKHRTFLFWPFLWSEKATESDRVRTRRMALPFFYTDRLYRPLPDDTHEDLARYWKVWPLMSWQREGDSSRFRMLELWPLKNTAPIERNWAPLWTLYKRTEQEGTVCKDLLWFGWHSESQPEADRAEWSLLKGLLAYKKQGDSKRFKMFYFIGFGDKE